ncbi:MAG: hypothetical protein E7633_01290 [Ruminococcaceae bacterium]|nr:hypothetical protein [Oscillospiraceae bacterium]
MEMMKQVVSVGPRKSTIIEVPKPTINANQVLVKNKYVGVCMSEHYDWSTAKEGTAFGHEPLGVIAEIGANVKGWKVGDKVSGFWGSGLPGGGGMVEYAPVNPNSIYKIPENVRDVDCILEPLACMMSAVSKAKISMPGTEVCVVGAGYMGCGAISLLRMRGAYVIAVDPRKESRENALKYGADEVYTPEEMWEKIRGGFRGYKCVMEWGETNESLDLAIHLTKECGQLCLGAYHTGDKRLVNVQLLNVRAIECLSTHPREAELSREGARNAVRMLSDKRWCYQNIPTKVYPMSKFDQAQADLETKYGIFMKAVIDMETLDGEPYIV